MKIGANCMEVIQTYQLINNSVIPNFRKRHTRRIAVELQLNLYRNLKILNRIGIYYNASNKSFVFEYLRKY